MDIDFLLLGLDMVNIRWRIAHQIKLASEYIVNQIKLASEYIKDYRLKNSRLAIFIKCHTISLSLLIILIGILAIYSSYSTQTMSNTIKINPRSATEGSLIRYEGPGISYSRSFNPQYTSLIDIGIDIKHKKPLSCSDYLNLDSISVYIDKREYASIKDIDIQLKRSDGSEIRTFSFNLTKLIVRDFLYRDELEGGSLRTVKIFERYNGESIWPVKPDPNNQFEFFYKLKYNDFENQTFEIYGKANLGFPIRCMDSVEETSNSINNSLFRLTWVLIILGAFPFFATLKQLLEKNDKS